MRDSTGLTYLRARYLNTGVGRFTQKDPSRQEANLYLYAGANPVVNVDPSGNAFCRWGTDPETGLCNPPPDWAIDLPPFLSVLLTKPTVSTQDVILALGVCTFTYLVTQLAPEVETLPDIDLYEFFREQFGRWEYPEVNPEPAPVPVPESLGPDIYPVPRLIETPRTESKHITLGLASALTVFGMEGGVLLEFTHILKSIYKPMGIGVYYHGEWQTQGLSDVDANPFRNLYIAIPQAMRRSQAIHFNLEYIDDPITYANLGFPGDFRNPEYITAQELYYIKERPDLCLKTKFYENGRLNPIPSIALKQKICGGSYP